MDNVIDSVELDKVNNTFSIFGITISEPWATLINLALIIIIGAIAIKIILTVVRHFLKKDDHLDDMLNTFVVNVVRTACIIILIAICLDTVGVSIGTIVAVLGAAGAAIALALKDSLSNIAGGIMIIINQPFGKGDLVRVGEYRGRVQEIDLFLTTLRTLNYEVITIPNGLINTSILVNESREETRRVDLKFGISYGSDVALAKEIMQKTCDECDMILDEPKPIIGVRSNDDSAVVLDLMAYCRTEDFFNAGYYLQENVKLNFEKAGIQIPFPQMDVHVKQE